MLSTVHPKLPSRNLKITKDFYLDKLKFQQFGNVYPDYLMLNFKTLGDERIFYPRPRYEFVDLRREQIISF